MPTTKRTENDDEVLAEQWMLESGYVTRPPRSEDPYQIRRIMRMSFANGVTRGRIDGLKHPHFTSDDIIRLVNYIDNRDGIVARSENVTDLLKQVFPEATFDE